MSHNAASASAQAKRLAEVKAKRRIPSLGKSSREALLTEQRSLERSPGLPSEPYNGGY